MYIVEIDTRGAIEEEIGGLYRVAWVNRLEEAIRIVIEIHKSEGVPYRHFVIEDDCGGGIDIGWLVNQNKRFYVVESLVRVTEFGEEVAVGEEKYFVYDGCLVGLYEDFETAKRHADMWQESAVLEIVFPEVREVYSKYSRW